MLLVRASDLSRWGFCPFSLYLDLSEGPLIRPEMEKGAFFHDQKHKEFLEEAVEVSREEFIRLAKESEDWVSAEAEKTLVSKKNCLCGRIDAAETRLGEIRPVEYKTLHGAPDPTKLPYEGHRLQVLAYCVLTQEEYPELSVKEGVLRYFSKNVSLGERIVKYGTREKKQLFSAVDEIKKIRLGLLVPEKQFDEKKCSSCGRNCWKCGK